MAGKSSSDNPRAEAASALQAVTAGKLLSGKAVDNLNQCPFSDKRDFSLAVNILLGCLQNLKLLDFFIEKFSLRKAESLDGFTKAVLETGLYQLLFLDKIPFSAAVNESVELMKQRNPKASGLVNAVLRKAATELEKQSDKLSYINKTVTDAKVRYSVSDDLYSYISARCGSAFAEDFLKATFDCVSTDLRVNTQKISVAEYEKLLSDSGFTYRRGLISENVIRVSDSRVSAFPGFSEGLFFVQDEAAATVAEIADLKDGMKVLDCCASPGGKSFSSALMMHDTGTILSCDINEKKAAVISGGALRLGLNCICSAVMNASVYSENSDSSFDAVICDVPCSGFGVIRKKPEVKFKSFSEVKRLPEIQSAILNNVAKYVKQNGVLVYSTCTVLKEENEDVVNAFLSDNPGFVAENFELGTLRSEEGMHTFWPNIEDTDGFFVAKLRRLY